MLKVVLWKNRKDGVSVEGFRRHMTDDRPPEIRGTPGVRRYVASFPLDPDDAEYDSIEEMYFETEEDMREAFDSEAADRAHAKGVDFIDFDNERLLVVEEALELDFQQ